MKLSELPDHELRKRLLQHLADRAAVPFNIRDMRMVVMDDEGLELVRKNLAASGE